MAPLTCPSSPFLAAEILFYAACFAKMPPTTLATRLLEETPSNDLFKAACCPYAAGLEGGPVPGTPPPSL